MRAISFLHSYVLTSFSLRFEFTNYELRRALCVNSLTFRQTQFVTRKRYTQYVRLYVRLSCKRYFRGNQTETSDSPLARCLDSQSQYLRSVGRSGTTTPGMEDIKTLLAHGGSSGKFNKLTVLDKKRDALRQNLKVELRERNHQSG